MKTDDLIRTMAADPRPEPGVARYLAMALGAGGFVSAAVFVLALGPRPDLIDAFHHLRVVLKPLLGLVLAGAALGAALAAARPGADPRGWRRWLLVAPVFAGLAFLVQAAATPASDWASAAIGQSSSLLACIVSIPLLSLPLLAGSLLALRHGASVDPRRTGALAGLLSGGIAVAIYGLHCIEDSPLFYGVWYSLGVLGVMALASRKQRRSGGNLAAEHAGADRSPVRTTRAPQRRLEDREFAFAPYPTRALRNRCRSSSRTAICALAERVAGCSKSGEGPPSPLASAARTRRPPT